LRIADSGRNAEGPDIRNSAAFFFSAPPKPSASSPKAFGVQFRDFDDCFRTTNSGLN
jgi:hypothetical protein